MAWNMNITVMEDDLRWEVRKEAKRRGVTVQAMVIGLLKGAVREGKEGAA